MHGTIFIDNDLLADALDAAERATAHHKIDVTDNDPTSALPRPLAVEAMRPWGVRPVAKRSKVFVKNGRDACQETVDWTSR